MDEQSLEAVKYRIMQFYERSSGRGYKLNKIRTNLRTVSESVLEFTLDNLVSSGRLVKDGPYYRKKQIQ